MSRNKSVLNWTFLSVTQLKTQSHENEFFNLCSTAVLPLVKYMDEFKASFLIAWYTCKIFDKICYITAKTNIKSIFKDYQAYILYFIENNAHTCVVYNFILQFYLNTLFMNKVGECYLPSIVRRQYYAIILNEKRMLYTQ